MKEVLEAIERRLAHLEISLAPEVLEQLATYLTLLARWNRRINLTALGLEPLSDQAIDRLILEPFVAHTRIWSTDRIVVDLGSGGGSPAIPLKVFVPSIELVMVEARSRKSVFLREVVRALELADVRVENRRFTDLLAREEYRAVADVVTARAVRLDDELWSVIDGLLTPAGRLLYFGSVPFAPEVPGQFIVGEGFRMGHLPAWLTIVRRALAAAITET